MFKRTRIPSRIALLLASLHTTPQLVSRAAGPKAECLIQALEPRMLLSGSLALGTDNAIAYDAQGTLHVAYYDTTTKSLMYATETQAGVWSTPVTVDNSSSDVGQQVALALGPGGKVGLAYIDAAKSQLRFATLSGSAWQTTAIDPKNGLGQNPSIAFDAKGRAHVSYYRPAAGDLRMATQVSATKWQVSSVLGKHKADQFSSLATSSNGQTALAYETSKGQVILKSGKNGNFSSSKTVAVLPGASDLSANFDAKNAPAVTFYNPTTGALDIAAAGAKNKYVTTNIATVPAGQDPKPTLFYNVPARSLQVVYYDAGQNAVYSASPNASGTTYNVTQLGSGGGSTMTAAMVPGTGAITYTNADPNSAVGGAPTPLPAPHPLNAPGSAVAPSNVAATVLSTSSIKLTWTDNSAGADTFEIKRSTNNSTFTNVGSVAAKTTTWTDTTAAASTTYYYDVYAVASNSTMALGSPAPVTATTSAIPASAPTNVTATAISSATIQLSWTDNSNGQDTFQIKRSTDGGQTFTNLATTPAKTNSYSDTGLTATTAYSYQVIAVAPNNATAMGNPSPVSATTLAVNANNPQYLLTPQMITQLRAAAQANTTQWQTFKASLDAGLNKVTEGDYEGWQLPALANYALAYQVLKQSDPTTAAGYADKAIAIMLQGIQDDVRGEWTGSRMYLARGDGSTTQFTLPNTGISASTLKVWTPSVIVKTMTKGAANGQDTADYSAIFLKASNTPDGPANYVEGTDWRYNPSYIDGNIDWSLGSANQPTTGSTYYVTEAAASDSSIQNGGYTLSGTTLTFTTAPAANQAIFVEYQYNGATNKYQQTGDGRGGFNNILIDSGYTARNLKYIAIGLDWLWDYQNLSPQVRTAAQNLLVSWSAYMQQPSTYMSNVPASNYGAGYYALEVASAIALQNRDATDAPQLQAQVKSIHDTYVLPLFQAPANGLGTEQGGFWSEGWNYGAAAVQNLLTSDLAYETAGWGSAAPDRSWAGDAITAMLTEQSTPTTIFDGGDGYAYPLPFPTQTMLNEMAYAAGNSSLSSYVAWADAHGAGAANSPWEDLLFPNTATATFWGNNLPLQYLSPGIGLAVARKDWNYNSTWLSFHSGNLTAAAHQPTDQGGMEINRGGDALLVNTAAVTGDQTFQDKSKFGNLLVVDDGGAGQQVYRYSEGVWYGNPGVTMPHFDGGSNFAYMQGNYAAAYTSNTATNPTTELVRDVFYVRDADYVIVYDRATTTQPQFLKQLRWHFLTTPTVSGNSWTVTQGTSHLFGQTFSDVPLTTTEQTVSVNGTPLQEISTNNTSATASVRYVTAMQVAPSSTSAMDASTHVESGDGKVEGVQMGNDVVLFGKNGAVTTATSYSVTAASGATLTHYMTDMIAGKTYTLSGADQPSAIADAQGVLTFTTTGTGSAQTITATPN